ncbi:TetR family transcriptional regulator [Paenibacillus tritici]|uniref:TetR family transcriptional regulator n=1 Tax=Paenibacillus tritici TaxID=1873425 RepID=A0ABX2DI74_9BACL|nr:TetR family transcriptional regulator [Paenibacillus tritici]NQX43758.1 TetR family transcriptional regulator [Paenibacillus tritici]
MEDKRPDPRTIRTRKLLVDAFTHLTNKKDFKDITIKDITDQATLNRATFYAHFEDKYELMENAISEGIVEQLGDCLKNFDTLNKETMINIFMLLTTFQRNFENELTSQCKRSFQSFRYIFESKIKFELEKLFQTILQNDHQISDSESIKVGASVLSAGIFGATLDWKLNSTLSAEQYIQYAIPYISGEFLGHNTQAAMEHKQKAAIPE